MSFRTIMSVELIVFRGTLWPISYLRYEFKSSSLVRARPILVAYFISSLCSNLAVTWMSMGGFLGPS